MTTHNSSKQQVRVNRKAKHRANTLYHTPVTTHPLPYTLYHTPFTTHPIPYTLYNTPFTTYPLPYTLYYTPFTIHTTLYTIRFWFHSTLQTHKTLRSS